MRTIIKNTTLLATTLMIFIITGGCNQERFPSYNPDGSKMFTIHGRTSDMTKAGSDMTKSGSTLTKTGYDTENKDIYWEKGDSIGVFISGDTDNANVLFKQKNFNASSPYSCDFEGEFTEDIEGSATKTVYAYYPYQDPYTNSDLNLSSATLSESTLTMNFPADQVYHGDGCFTHLPAVGKYEGALSDMNITFQNMYTLIRLTLTADEISTGVYPKLMNIRFKSNTADMNVAGPMSVDMSESTLTPVYTTLDKAEIVLSMGGANVELNGTGRDFYIAVPSMEYKDGYTITIQTDKGIDVRNITHSSVKDLSTQLNVILLTPATTVNPKMWIEDDTFRSYLKDMEYITVDEVLKSITLTDEGEKVTDMYIDLDIAYNMMNLDPSDIKSLQGIEYFTALTDLNCSYAGITTLDVSNNTALLKLNFVRTGVTAIDVSKNTALTDLDCSSTGITTLDVSKNTALTDLHCSITGITTLDVSENTELIDLYCGHTGLTSLDVSKNTALTGLDCSSTGITTLDVSANTALTTLYCYSTGITTLDVSKNTALIQLYCSTTGITSLDVSNNTEFSSLSCYNSPIEELNISNCGKLADLILYTNSQGYGINAISSSTKKLTLPSGSESSLKRFIANNLGPYSGTNYRITSVECIGNTKIESLSFDGCKGITTMNLKDNTALKSLSIVGSGPSQNGAVNVTQSGNHTDFAITLTRP